MGPEDVLDVARDTIWVFLQVGGPVLAIALVAGLVIALFQALTQIQELTLTFVPKLIVTFVSLLLLLPFIGSVFSGFMARLATRIAGLS